MKAIGFYRSLRLLWLMAILTPVMAGAQTQPSAEDLFKQARYQAFEAHNYGEAKALCLAAVAASPRDPGYGTFLGRLYAWSHVPDSARMAFRHVLDIHPGYEDA